MSEKRLALNAASSVVQVVLKTATLFFTYKLLIDALSIEEIGLWALVIGSAAVARVSEFGLGSGIVRFVATDLGAGEPTKAAQSVAMAAVTVAALVGVFAAIAYPLALPLLLKATPPEMRVAAHALLYTALFSVVATAISNVFSGAIDGCQRMDVRSLIQILAGFVQLGATWWILPRYGLAGLGWAQVAQALFLVAAGGTACLLLLRQPLSAYFGFDRARLKELLGYGGGLQLIAVAQLLFEPLTKVLLTSFSGLALTGYFDMANRLVVQLRSLIITAYRALVPHVAQRIGREGFKPEAIRATYREAAGMLMLIVLPFQACLAAILPLALYLWTGQVEPILLQVALLQIVAWSANIITPAAYMLFLATGKIRANIIGHMVIGLLTLVLGFAFGQAWAGPGVLVGSALALIVGSLVLLIAFHHDYSIPLRELLPLRRGPAVLLLIVVLAGMAWLSISGLALDSWSVLLGAPMLIGVLALAAAAIDPALPPALARIRSITGRKAVQS